MIIPCDNSQIILTHSRGFSFLTFLCALSSSSGDFTSIYSQRRTVCCALFTPLSLSPLYPSISLSLPLFHSLYPSLSLLLSLPLSLSLLSLPPSLYLSFYLSFSLFPSLSLLFIIFFGVSNGRFRPCSYLIPLCL